MGFLKLIQASFFVERKKMDLNLRKKFSVICNNRYLFYKFPH